MKKLLVLSLGSPMRLASTKYRIAQHEKAFAHAGYSLEYVERKKKGVSTIAKIFNCDLVLNQKALISPLWILVIRAFSKRLVFEFDDAIWTRGINEYSASTLWRVKRRTKLWIRHADLVVAANEYLANYARQFASRVEVVGMALDLDVWSSAANSKDSTDLVLMGWAGSPVGAYQLVDIEPALKRALDACPTLRLAVYSGERPKLSLPFEYVPFVPGTEQEFIRRLDIGLLPIENSGLGKGKSPMKSIQYLACGVPVVGNICGATAEILDHRNAIAVSTEDEWVDAIISLVRDSSMRKVMGQAARKKALDCHDAKLLGPRYVEMVISN